MKSQWMLFSLQPPVTNSHISHSFRLVGLFVFQRQQTLFAQCPAGPIPGQQLYTQTFLPSSVPQFLHLGKKKSNNNTYLF